MMNLRHILPLAAALACFSQAGLSYGAECAGNPNALGTSRVMVLDTEKGLELGKQYDKTLPLQPKEVVLTFDDGPLPPYSTRAYDLLKAECIRASFFLIGRNAKKHPDLVKRIAQDGHTVATHSMNHPLNLPKRPAADGLAEINQGIEAVSAALGEPTAPYFRFPGLGSTRPLREYLKERGIANFGIDMEGGDWFQFFTPEAVLNRVMSQLETEQRGIILLHDVQPRTVDMLPQLFARLKAGGYKVVHVIPKEAAEAKTMQIAATTPADLMPAVPLRAKPVVEASSKPRPKFIDLGIPVESRGASTPTYQFIADESTARVLFLIEAAAADHDTKTLMSDFRLSYITTPEVPAPEQQTPNALAAPSVADPAQQELLRSRMIYADPQ